MTTRHLIVAAALLVLPFAQTYGQGGQCTDVYTQTYDECLTHGGDCKFNFDDPTCEEWGCITFEISPNSDPGACVVSAQACALQPNKLDVTAYDCQAEPCPDVVTDLPTIDTECRLYQDHKKCITYKITHEPSCVPSGPTNSQKFDTAIWATPSSNQSVGSPRIVMCSGTSPLCQDPTANITNLYPSGEFDPIRGKTGSTIWWGQQVPSTGAKAFFGDWQLPSSCHVGSTCVLKFTLFDEDGSTSEAQGPILLSIQLIDPCDGFCPVEALASPGSAETPPFFRFTGDHWHFNWIPAAPGVYQITVVFLNRNVPEQSETLCVDVDWASPYCP